MNQMERFESSLLVFQAIRPASNIIVLKEVLKSAPPLNSHAAKFIFATETGLILGYNAEANPTTAILGVDRTTAGSIYKGLAIAVTSDEPFIYAADFFNALIDVFDSEFNYVTSFTDTTVPAGYAPHNIRNIDGKLYVAFALQNETDSEPVPGLGNGFVDVFSPQGTLIQRLVSNGNLNAPWGLEIAPDNFGKFSEALLVGNFGDGIINAYNPSNGNFLGQLTDKNGAPIIISGLWALSFSPEDDDDDKRANLFFTSGPGGQTHGLVGRIHPRK